MGEDLLIQKVANGTFADKTAIESTKETNTKGTTNLGKDAFLQLLVAEMQNQDPLEPSTNTEWISQLATFSQLEELQSLSSTTENSQLFQMIGKNVIVTTEASNGTTLKKSGVVDFVTCTGGETKFSVGGALYSIENLYSVVDENYLYEKNAPYIKKDDQTYTFNGNEPADISFEVDMGTDIAEAKNVALLIGDVIIPSDYVTRDGGKISISADILQEMRVGAYKVDLIFDDKNYTTVKNAFTIQIYNSHPTVKDDGNEKPENADKPSDNGEVKDSDNNKKSSETSDPEKKNDGDDKGKDDKTSEPEKSASGDNNSSRYEKDEDKIGYLKGFDYDEVRALYPELTDEEFEDRYGYMFED